MHTIAKVTWTLLAGLALAGTGRAATTTLESCLKAREFAAATYASCHHKALGKLYQGAYDADLGKFHAAMSKCSVKYQATWPLLQARYPGTSCAAPRFVDSGDQTVTDNLTGLVWEQKDDLGGLHDKDATRDWSTGAPWREDGAVFDTFLAGLNGAAFGGSRGWRLPTFAELQTIVSEPYPCATNPCIDPVFGPTGSSLHWSSSTNALNAGAAWGVDFANGLVLPGVKNSDFVVRAVRGG